MNNYNHCTLIPETHLCETCNFIVLRSRDFVSTLHYKNASSPQIELCPPCRTATSIKERSSDVFFVKGIIRCVYLEHHLPMSNAITCLPCCECWYNLSQIHFQQQAFLIISSFWTSRKGLKHLFVSWYRVPAYSELTYLNLSSKYRKLASYYISGWPLDLAWKQLISPIQLE